MTAILERADQALSITEVSRSTKEIVDKLVAGEQDHYVVMRNNAPAAILMNIETYESLLNELEDFRIESIAKNRLQTFDKEKVVSHQEMLKIFDQR
jgi:antitoxin StbD